MRFGRVIKHSPNSEPQKSQCSRNYKRGSPATEIFVKRYHQQRSDRTANRTASVEKGNCPAAFLFWKPFGNRFGRGRPIRGLTRAEQKTKEREAAQSDSERRQHRGNRILDDRDRQTFASSDAVDETTGECLPDRISHP